MKKYTKEIMLVLITAVVVSVVSVSATVYFNSENITFVPDNTNWNASNTNTALNDLYSYANSGDATASNILVGKTALVNGTLITGTMTNRGTLNWNPTTSTTYTIPAGYYSGGTLDSTSAYNAGYNAGTTKGMDIINAKLIASDSTSSNGYKTSTFINLGCKYAIAVVSANFGSNVATLTSVSSISSISGAEYKILNISGASSVALLYNITNNLSISWYHNQNNAHCTGYIQIFG